MAIDQLSNLRDYMKQIVNMILSAGKVAVLAASLGLVAPAQAAVIYDQSNGGDVNGIGWSNDGAYWSVWDDFHLNSGAALTGISYFTNNTWSSSEGDYRLRIGTSAGQSDVLDLAIANSSTSHSVNGWTARIDASFSAVNLDAGTYWMSFASPQNLWGSANISGASLTQISSYWGTAAYTRDNSAAVFMLTGNDGTSANGGTVPEPGSLALLGLGLVGFALARHKAPK